MWNLTGCGISHAMPESNIPNPTTLKSETKKCQPTISCISFVVFMRNKERYIGKEHKEDLLQKNSVIISLSSKAPTCKSFHQPTNNPHI